MGYCFVTYSLRDEAVLANVEAHYIDEYTDEALLTVPKGDLDHKNFDPFYIAQTARNEATLTSQREAIRHARNRLREYETDIDNQLPESHELRDFQRAARDLLERNGEHNRADPA